MKKIICPICEIPMDKLEEWDSNLKMTKIYKYGCSNCGAILEFKDYEKKYICKEMKGGLKNGTNNKN